MKTTIKLKQKLDNQKHMKVNVHRNKILSSKGFVLDAKYGGTIRIDLLEDKYIIPEPYQVEG